MDDKTFDLLTKMYSEFTGRFDNVDKEITGLKRDVSGLKNDVSGLKNDVIRLENKIDTNSKALFDGYSQTYEKLLEVDRKVDRLSDKVERHEVEIKILKAARVSST